MKNDPNWLVIRVHTWYADKIREISLGRIVGEAMRLQNDHVSHELSGPLRDDIYSNHQELEYIKNAVDAFSSAVREGFQLEHNAKQQPPNSLGVDDGAVVAIMMLETIIKSHPEQFIEIARRVDELMPGHS